MKWLAEIAGIEDLDTYAREMLDASISLKDAPPKEILGRDLKYYEVNKYKFAIGQTNYSRMEDVQLILPQFREYMAQEQQHQQLDLLVMLFTDVMGEGSIFVYYGPLSYAVGEVIETTFDEHYGFDSSIISRKQQLLPKLSQLIKNL